MSGLPFYLLEAMASRDEQVRYIAGGTADKYLVPEDLLNDAYHFCERAQRPDVWATLNDRQKRSVEALKARIEALPADALASATIIDHPVWLAMATQCRGVLTAFHDAEGR